MIASRVARRWSVGVTTVPQRMGDLLPSTLHSLKRAGFPEPRLFVDGAWEHQIDECWVKAGATCRMPRVGAYANWFLALHEMVVRDPSAHLYAVFQDDCACCGNLRRYLDSCRYPDKGYWNLITFKDNMDRIPAARKDPITGRTVGNRGWHEARARWRGLGAVGLVMDRKNAVALLTSPIMVNKHFSGPVGSTRKIDGSVVESLNALGIKEWVHNPSLVQHMGKESTIGNGYGEVGVGFPGEDVDVTETMA